MAVKNYQKQHVTVQGADGVYLGRELDAISRSIRSIRDEVDGDEGVWAAIGVLSGIVSGSFTEVAITPTPDSGSFTTVAGFIRTKVVGPIVYYLGEFTIDDVGTGAGGINIPLPAIGTADYPPTPGSALCRSDPAGTGPMFCFVDDDHLRLDFYGPGAVGNGTYDFSGFFQLAS